jgi:hypothetical protein
MVYLVRLVLWTPSIAVYVPYEQRIYWFIRWGNIFSAGSREKSSSCSPSQQCRENCWTIMQIKSTSGVLHPIVAFCMWLDSSCCDRALLLVLFLYSLNYVINKWLCIIFHVFYHTSLMCLYMYRAIQEQSVKLGRYISQVLLSQSIPVNAWQFKSKIYTN